MNSSYASITWMALVAFVTSYGLSIAEGLDPHISGVWRSDAGELLAINPHGEIMGSYKGFSGLGNQEGERLSISIFRRDDNNYVCKYYVVQQTPYYLTLNLQNVIDPPSYCPSGVFHKVDDFRK